MIGCTIYELTSKQSREGELKAEGMQWMKAQSHVTKWKATSGTNKTEQWMNEQTRQCVNEQTNPTIEREKCQPNKRKMDLVQWDEQTPANQET